MSTPAVTPCPEDSIVANDGTRMDVECDGTQHTIRVFLGPPGSGPPVKSHTACPKWFHADGSHKQRDALRI